MEQENQLDEEKVEAIVASRLQDKLKLVIIGLILLYLILTSVLLYFYNPARFFEPQVIDSTPITDITEFQSVSDQIGLGCPLDSSFCNSKLDVKTSGIYTVGYKAPEKSLVSSTTRLSTQSMPGLDHNLSDKSKHVYESVQMNNTCYTVVYTFADDAVLFSNVFDLPLDLTKRVIAAIGSKLLNIKGSDVSVLVQIHKKPIDPKYGCSLTGRAPRFFN